MKYLWLLLLPFYLQAEMTWKAPVKNPFAITIKIHSQKIPLDETLSLEAEFYYPSSYSLQTDPLIENLTASSNPLHPIFHLQNFTSNDLPAKESMKAQRLQIQLDPMQVGSFFISFLMINFESEDSAQGLKQILTPAFAIEILPSTLSIEQLTIAPLMPLEPEFPLGLTRANRLFLIDSPERIALEKHYMRDKLDKHTFPWKTLLLLITLTILVNVAYLKKEKIMALFSKKEAPADFKQQIQKEMSELPDLLRQGKWAFYYEKLASILMQFIQHSMQKNITDLTTDEVIPLLQKSEAFSFESQLEIKAFLTEIDQVKFANKTPSIESAELLFERIKNFTKR